MDWATILANVIPVLTVVSGFLLWLRQDMKGQEDRLDGRITQLRNDMTEQHEQLREEMNARFDVVESRLSGVETEQARVAGLLEGMALTGRLPQRDGALD